MEYVLRFDKLQILNSNVIISSLVIISICIHCVASIQTGTYSHRNVNKYQSVNRMPIDPLILTDNSFLHI